MRRRPSFTRLIALCSLVLLALPACASTPSEQPQEETAAPTAPAGQEPAIVAFVKDGDIHLWHEDTQQSEIIFNAGGVHSVTMSDDGRIIAFTRRWLDFNHCEQIALWAVDRDGNNPREIVSHAELRDTLGDTDCEYPSVILGQMGWLPQTHRLLYSVIWDAPHAPPQGLYLVDADAPSARALVSTDHSLRFVASPDGRQIALLSTTGLGFMRADGSDWRQEVLTYPKAGVPIALFPNGVWTRDGRAFLIVAPSESDSAFVLNYTLMHVPVDGSSAQPLTALSNSHGDSVTFSPDGRRAGFLQEGEPWAWFIIPLAAEVGPLSLPYAIDFGGVANLHWSPAGAAFVMKEGALFPLCPDAVQDSEVCGDPVNLGGRIVANLQWVDHDRFLFMTRDPYTLFLTRLDGTTTPIVTWGPEDPTQSFSALLLAPQR